MAEHSPVRLDRVKRLLVWCHRWIALTLGLLLVVVGTSGALVVYVPKKQDPEFEPAEIALKDGIFMLAGAESEMTYVAVVTGTTW